MLAVPSRGTTPPGEMDGACVCAAWLIFRSAPLAKASRTACTIGAFLELVRFCLTAVDLAIGSPVISRLPLLIIEADVLVTIAMAEPVTAA